ncbi:MAG TPA: hypothetical protein VHM19_03570 [Polyangiales bacterium]|jgi:hypothetical protein|nr:hypothetical protein [Polyangiales bacterium]
MLRSLPRLIVGLCLLAIAGGCAGASFRDGVYSDEHVRYRVGELDARWRRVEVEDGRGDLAFHRGGMGSISVSSTCTEYDDVPTTALVNHLLFETTARKFLVEEVVSLDGRGARHVVVQLELDGVPLEVEAFVMKKDGCVFDLTHIRGLSAPPEARAAFLGLVSRFAVLEVHAHG